MEAKKIRILHIISGFVMGGVEVWLLNTVKYLKQHPEIGLHFDFLATGGVPRIFDEEIKRYGCKIYYEKYSLKHFFRFRRSMVSILSGNSYDVIHDHQDFISGWHLLAGLGHLPNIKISHLHNSHDAIKGYITKNYRQFSYVLGRWLTFLLVTRITGTSEAVMNDYAYNNWPYCIKKMPAIYCGIDTAKFRFSQSKRNFLRKIITPTKKTKKIGLFLGRVGFSNNNQINNQKNPEFAFEIAKTLVQKTEEWTFLFVGHKGTTGDILEYQAKQDGLSDKIKFLGMRRDIPAILSSVDVLIFPSLGEGLGMVAVEAQASGLPIVMSDKVPTEAIVCRDLVTRLSLEDGVAKWSDAILRASSKKTLKRSAYAKYIERSPFSINKSVVSLSSCYSSICSKKLR